MAGNSLFLYVSTVLIWGTSWFAITFQLGVVSEQVSLVYRFALSSLLLLGFCAVTRRSLIFSPGQHLFMALQGVFLFATNYLVIYWATHDLSSGLIALAFSTIIVMNIVGSALVFGTPITVRVALGALCGLAGITLIFWPEIKSFDLDSGSLRALGLALLGTVLASVGNLLSARNQRNGTRRRRAATASGIRPPVV